MDDVLVLSRCGGQWNPADLAGFLIVLQVAGDARRGHDLEPAIGAALVAGIAVDGCVGTSQRETIVVLLHIFNSDRPSADRVALLAIRAQLAGTRPVLGTIIHLQLRGTSEPNASGTAVLRIRKDAGLICYRLHAENVTLPTIAAHIHRGAAGVNGPVVVPFTAPGANGTSSGCATAASSIIDDILANRAGFYVNVHTKEHPAGAIRAQLG